MNKLQASPLAQIIEEQFAAAFAHHAAGRLEEAEEDYRVTLAMEEHHAPTQHYLGMLLHQRGRHEEGVTLMRQAALAAPADADWCNDIGNVLFACSRFDEAAQAYQQALALRPDDAQLWTNLGATRRAQGQHQAAIAACEQALATAPHSLAALHQLAEIHAHLGDRMQSSRYQCMAFVLPPHEGKSRELLAISFYFLGRVAEAAEVCRRWLQEEPGHPIANHMHAAYAGLPSHTVPRDYIVRRFDDYADHFDSNLVTHLDYRGPQVLNAVLQASLPANADMRVLDAGCGTGLCAPVLAPYALSLEGVDLSSNMLRHAAQHGRYSTLAQADVVEWMTAHPSRYALIAACDVLIYCGQLASFFTAAQLALQEGGHLVFTVELAGAERPDSYYLHASGRFRHQRAYIEDCLHAAGMQVVMLREESLRVEMQQAVPGLVVLARR
ncbi:tetratricopeptide repeat protein [Herbaspirillum seropedicae]|uniref:Methyltransferase (Contains TPR repeat) protein n=1 Tax=Herbaspirillum seropedicae (strain SmR1) TaxID=757424 RepID=D8J1F4_HERSS|nr:tetratricopeptide repeat protein [Herbaspirillum seropedicae]ADJ64723.1 methyltransferase (contains TPR repeat) protein [Herbaspirillum seropedicae SmR1]AKN66631.1 methyltransferase [Herbaspirillum seropedicae]NQE28380.1 methyltransferase [Herbaspirillum seropedicae]UMU22620.1 tetratricopeptide repeat protein [Herbaspirillum seropedicae]